MEAFIIDILERERQIPARPFAEPCIPTPDYLEELGEGCEQDGERSRETIVIDMR